MSALGGGLPNRRGSLARAAIAAVAVVLALLAVAPQARSVPTIERFETAVGYGSCSQLLDFPPPSTGLLPAGSLPADAGAHPDVCTRIQIQETSGAGVDDYPRTLAIDLPPGVIGNPSAVEAKCPPSVLDSNLGIGAIERCPGTSQIGTAVVDFRGSLPGSDLPGAIFVVEPGLGQPARIVIAFQQLVPLIPVTVEVRTESDFGVTTISPEISTAGRFIDLELFFWGTPNANQRGGVPYEPSFGDVRFTPLVDPAPASEQRAFWTNPTVCDGPKLTNLRMTFYGAPNLVVTDVSADAAPTNCTTVPFEPSFDVQPSSRRADDATGLDVDLGIAQTPDPTVLGSSHLRRAEVTLPEGTTLNPSAGDGLAGCTDAQLHLHTRLPDECPDASKVGTVQLDVPLLDAPLKGSVYLGTPLSTDPQSGKMLRLFQVAEGFGTIVKIAGYAKADPITGRVTAVFGDEDADAVIDPGEGLPQVPFSNANIVFKGGSRGVLATPADCGTKTTRALLTPWAVADPIAAPRTRDVVRESSFSISEDGAGAPCPTPRAFSPFLTAGMADPASGRHSQFTFKLTRQDREQEVGGLTADLPAGLLAKVKGVPLCSNAQADADACPAGSRVGTVTAGSGAGSPLFLPGKVYLTEGYRGAPYGLSVAVPAVAGPFDLGVVVVRQAVRVDPRDASVHVVSDPLPTIWHGIPLRLRSIAVDVDRGGFMLNPSSCAAKRIGATVTSTRGATANLATPFQVRGCRGLGFEPRLSLRLTGKSQTTTGKHPGVKATVTQKPGEAGIRRVRVRLPKALALDPGNAQDLCELAAGVRDEPQCPKGAIIGHAKAVSPLLNRPLTGNVYFVKNVRRDAKTGNPIRTLPMLVVALRGEIAINLRGTSSTTKSGQLVNTFDDVPDAPISRFELDLAGGRHGILAVTRTRRRTIDICRRSLVAEADVDGQNGRRFDRQVRLRSACAKRSTPAR